MIAPQLLAPDAADRAVGNSFFGRAIFDNLDREAAAWLGENGDSSTLSHPGQSRIC
jgi:hypothetical protein